MNVCRSLVACGLLLLGFSTVLVAGEARTWTDITGNTIDGELLDVTSNHHALLRVDGETVSIPFSIFSEHDQKHLKSWKKNVAAESDPATEPTADQPTSSQAEAASPAAKPEVPVKEDSPEPSADKPEKEPSTVITADNYMPPVRQEKVAYFCTNCDHELSASIGVGDHCPNCDVLIEYEEDENGNVIAGKRDLPWYARTLIKIGAAIATAGIFGLWRLRHLLLVPFSGSRKEPDQFEMPGDVWQKST